MIILGIETSCDETALALIVTRELGANGAREYRVIQSLVHSQAKLHSSFGGVFPALAKREHSKNLVPLLEKILKDLPTKASGGVANNLDQIKKQYAEQNSDLLESFNDAHFILNIPNIDCIAVTEGPGLEPALWVGITFSRILGELWGIPVVPVNHMEGHIIGSLLEDDKPYGTWQKLKDLPLPSVALLISGGHTELIKIEQTKEEAFHYNLLGQTRDDAVGEAFDKVARLLGLPYPGGPHISKLAHEAWEQKISSPTKLPRPMINSKDLNFSFSGLKTAVLYAVKDETTKMQNSKNGNTELSDEFKKGLAYEFEQSVSEVLDKKLRQAVEDVGAQSIIIGGGVSANHLLRKTFSKVAEDYNIPIFLPSVHISGDNALMIALVGALNSAKYMLGQAKDIHAQGTKKLVP